jgi:SAM-dependent methyltransferase
MSSVAWDREYERRGIPSSFREEPSGALVWALENMPLPGAALDAGCGTGRNTAYLRTRGVSAVGLDYSTVALARARVPVVRGDLTEGLPFRGAQFDLVCDLFVYKHIIPVPARAAYRKEIARVLRPDGRLLLSLAHVDDGYYAACPKRGEAVFDPTTDVASVLFTMDELIAEMSDLFTLATSIQKEKPGMMHGRRYRRRTMATIWRHPVID